LGKNIDSIFSLKKVARDMNPLRKFISEL